VPKALPALVRAHQLGEKAAHLGLDWDAAAGVFDKVREEQTELESAIASGDRTAVEHELGDLLLTLASLGRHLDVSAEIALRAANDRFVGSEACAACHAASETIRSSGRSTRSHSDSGRAVAAVFPSTSRFLVLFQTISPR
jgi:uncharacterized protein YabN with tetrapyrrole methylase and pyrophosphatase domain